MPESLEPSTPIVHEHTPRSKTDTNEVLFGHDEMSEDESADDLFHEVMRDDVVGKRIPPR